MASITYVYTQYIYIYIYSKTLWTIQFDPCDITDMTFTIHFIQNTNIFLKDPKNVF